MTGEWLNVKWNNGCMKEKSNFEWMIMCREFERQENIDGTSIAS